MSESEIKTPPPSVGPWADTIKISQRGDLSPSFLEKLRYLGGGPPFVKVGRAVRYSIPGFDQWMSTREKRPQDLVSIHQVTQGIVLSSSHVNCRQGGGGEDES